MRFLCCFFLFLLSLFPLSAQRSFNEIFPGISATVRDAAFSSEGFYRSSEKASSSVLAGSGQSAIDPQIIEAVFLRQPRFLVESIVVVPGDAGQYSLLDVYNALGKIRGLKGRLYHSATRNENIPLFEDVTRIQSAQKNNPVADPPSASKIPSSETIYVRLKDVNFGNTYYRGDIALVHHGLRYSLSNNRNVTYFFVPVIKEEKFIAQLYFEPIEEGILIYALAGVDVSDFVSSKLDMASAIGKRLAVIIGWVAEGITAKGAAKHGA
ncbi:MAG: hypothetical protein LBB89_03435 [Treponema sp.]|nr:hypothetical protein [Treponema sp.]